MHSDMASGPTRPVAVGHDIFGTLRPQQKKKCGAALKSARSLKGSENLPQKVDKFGYKLSIQDLLAIKWP